MKKSTKKQLLARILTAVMGLSLIGCAAESSPANAGAEETETGITKEETAVEQPAEENSLLRRRTVTRRSGRLFLR